MTGKIYAGILVDRVCRVTKGLIDNKKRGFRSGRGFADQIFTLKHIGEKALQEKTKSACVFNRSGKGVWFG